MSEEKSSQEKAKPEQTAKEEALPTVSHSEPAEAGSREPVLPLAETGETHKHDPYDQTTAGHGDGDHVHSPLPADFGEVIPGKNWQDSFLAFIALCVLGGFIWLGIVWCQIPVPNTSQPEQEGSGGQVEPSHAAAGESAPLQRDNKLRNSSQF